MDFWYKTERSARRASRQIRLKLGLERRPMPRNAGEPAGLSLFAKALITAGAGGLITVAVKVLVDVVVPLVAQHLK
jgi:hypothetical protein